MIVGGRCTCFHHLFPYTFRVYVIGGNKVVFVSLISLQAFNSHSEPVLQDDYIRPSNMTIFFHRRTRRINILEFWSRHTEVGIDIRRWARVPSVRIPDKAREFSLFSYGQNLLWDPSTSYSTDTGVSLSGLTFKSRRLTLCTTSFNPLNTKSRQLYLKTQFVPRSKYFSSLL